MKRIFALLAVASVICVFSCKKGDTTPTQPEDKTPTDKTDPQKPDDGKPEDKTVKLVIDGKFEDWAAADQTKIKSFKNNPDSPWDAVKEIRVYANADFVYFYIRYNHDSLEEQLDLMEGEDGLPIRLCLNTDGEFTSGYENYFLECYDFIVEGAVATGGEFTDFDGTLHQRVNGSWTKLLDPNNNLVFGKGSGDEYEIMLAREIFNNAVPADQKMGDKFYAGVRFYDIAWGELSNMPNASAEEGEGNGWGHLLEITTDK